MGIRAADVSTDTTDRIASPFARTVPSDAAPLRESPLDVLSREQFLECVHLEKRRADRSHAPLSIVVMKFAQDGDLDLDDLQDVIIDLSRTKRETDSLGYLGSGRIGFLLPYSAPSSAEAFSKSIVQRIDTPAVSVECATYTDSRFDALIRESLVGSEVFLRRSSEHVARASLALFAQAFDGSPWRS